VVDLVRSAPDVDVTVPATPAWTVPQALGHLVNVTIRFGVGPEGGGTWADEPPDLAAINERELSALGGLDVGDLDGQLHDAVEDVIGRVEGYGLEVPTYRYHGGAIVVADRALGILLGEFLIHGMDIAAALRRPFPIPRGEAGLAIDGVVPIATGWVDPVAARGHTATYEIRIREGSAYTLAFRDGTLDARDGRADRADCRISADPAAFLPVLYRRRSPWRYVPTGGLVAWGRRPWLGLRLAGRFHRP
jgi:SCP-2 sterol transfer family